MKISAFILLLAFGISSFQPAFCYLETDAVAMQCSEEMECSPVSGCSAPEEDQPADNDQTEKEGCLMIVCSNCTFTLVDRLAISIRQPFAPKQEQFTWNDNRVINSSSDVWNPPKAY